MSSKKEEERNEKIIRGLLKLPPNRRCINCNSQGPQYVCTNFWTFICVTCSGVHREFTHRVKSVSMAKFTSQEVDALQRGGNQRARESYLKDYDPMQLKYPDSRNVDSIREFIKSVYVDKKYAGEKNFEKPPRDLQNNKMHTEDHRRASSYHSYSQSPPYDYQYEEHKINNNGKKINNNLIMLTRKPGSDRGNYEGKLASFLSLPINNNNNNNQIDQINDVNENNLVNGSLCSNRTLSSGSIGSFDSISIKSADSNNDNFDEINNSKINLKTNTDLFSQNSDNNNTGWANFDDPSPINIKPVYESNEKNEFEFKIEKFAPLTDLFPSDFNDNNKLGLNEATKVSEVWNAFEDLNVNTTPLEIITTTSNISQNWFSFEDNTSVNLNSNSTQSNIVTNTTNNNPFANDELCEVSTEDWVQKLSIDSPFNLSEDKISNNPFDIPFDASSESLDLFMDLGPLEKTMPDSQISNAFVDIYSPQGGLPNLTGQASSSPFTNMVEPTAVTSGNRNPFA